MKVVESEYRKEVDRINEEIKECYACNLESKLGFKCGCDYHRAIKKYFTNHVEVIKKRTIVLANYILERYIQKMN